MAAAWQPSDGSRTSTSRPAEEPPELLVEDVDEVPKVATVSGDQSLEQDQALLYHMQHKELSVKAAQKEKARAARRPKPWTLSSRFNMVVGLVIMLNALSMGLEADYGILAPAVFLGLEHFFAAAFLLELLLHLWAEGWQMYFGDRANWLDFGLVVMSVSDIWIIQQIGIEADMRLMSLMRLIRLTRLARLLRLFRIFKELTLIIEGFMAGAKALTWSFLFLLIMVYIFAIFARLQIGSRYVCSDDETEVSEGVACPADAGGGMPVTLFAFNPEIGTQQQLFGSMELTMLTLFICLSEGCGVEIIHPTVRRSPLLFAYWLIFVVTTTFGILNLIVGIFCENMMKIALETERDIMRSQEDVRRQKLEELRRAFQRMDNDGSGNISREEFSEAIVQNNEVINAMVALGLDEEKDLFDAIDADHSGSLEFNEFFDGVTLIMKGQEPALAKDMVATYLRVCGLAKANGRLEKRLHALGGEQQQAYVRIETRLDELLRPPAQARETVLEALPGN